MVSGIGSEAVVHKICQSVRICHISGIQLVLKHQPILSYLKALQFFRIYIIGSCPLTASACLYYDLYSGFRITGRLYGSLDLLKVCRSQTILRLKV